VYLDLERPADLNKLNDLELFMDILQDQTVILDEVQRLPKLFPELRGIIDSYRIPGRFLLLGSASPELIRDTSESLAGRIVYYELSPLMYAEISQIADFRSHWLRGGFPDSILAPNDEASLSWRTSFIQTYLERDLPMLGLSANPIMTRRLWTMLAHWNGNMLNYESLGNSLGITGVTVRRYLDFFESAYLIRRIPPWFPNISKRVVKSPKIYIRDTGILHALLSVGSIDELHNIPTVGASWEAYIIQTIAAYLPPLSEMCFYRTQDGTEADIVIVKGGKPDVLVEIKYSSSPKITKSMRTAAADLLTRRNVIIAPIEDRYPLGDGFEVMSYKDIPDLF
jgi:predicted AAA+ superfamily ATPase